MHTGAARIRGRSAAARHMYSPHLDQSAGHGLIASATGTVARRLLHRSRDRRHCGVCERSRCENRSAGCGLSACADSYRARSARHGRRLRHGSRQHEPRLPSGGRWRQRCSLFSTGLRRQTTRCEHCVSTAPRIIGLVDADAGCSGDGRWHAHPSLLRRRWRWIWGRRIVTNNGRKRQNESSCACQHACLTFSSSETR